ncbi:helix-turn-helix domain-containing protein [Bacteroides ovatus]|nr:helix-turn-helix domain-containing protein [Bacteroides ovatus]
MMNENNDVFTMEDEPIASVVQDMRKGSKWLSAFLESYRPPLDGERYLTDGEVSELLRVSRRTLQEYRNNRVLPFILLGGKVLYICPFPNAQCNKNWQCSYDNRQ